MMKQIELVPALELGNKLNIDVMDFPEMPEGSTKERAVTDGADGEHHPDLKTARRRKRCGITLEYAPRDVRELKAQGCDLEGMLDYYRQRIYELVKRNIAQDWECAGGMEEVMNIVEKHISAVK